MHVILSRKSAVLWSDCVNSVGRGDLSAGEMRHNRRVLIVPFLMCSMYSRYGEISLCAVPAVVANQAIAY